ncbi:MAG: TonB-dependent receptor, partial [Bacteroidota bacterium]
LEALHALGMNFGTGAAVPKYKDLSFKLNFPLPKGRLSVFGLGGDNNIAMLDSREDDAQYGFSGTDLYYGNRLGVVGLNHTHYLSENERITTSLAVSGIEGSALIYDLGYSTDRPSVDEVLREVKYTLSGNYSKRFNSRNFLRAGIVYDYYDFSYQGKEMHRRRNQYQYYLNSTGKMSFARVFAEWRHRFSDEFSVTSGLHGSGLFLNNTYGLEPRVGMKWEFIPGQSVNFGAGLHSQNQMRAVYFGQTLVDTVSMHYEMTNRELDMSRSAHFVAGYERLLGEGHRIKAEAYYQYLYNIPVAWRRPEFSLLNSGGGYGFFLFDDMENSGTGENKGIEITLEKFLHQGFYYLATASVFDAGYRGYDGVWRNSAFNNNFVFNVLGGYEWKVGRKSLLSLDMKMVYAGGSRYLPIDTERSQADDTTRYDWHNAYRERFPDYFRLNSRITFRLNGHRINQEWALDLQNITNRQNIYTQNWDSLEKQISTSYQMGFMPMMTYRIYF